MLFAGILNAQYKFEAGDLTKIIRAIGTYDQSTSGSVQVDLKQPGTGIVWDFSNLNMGNVIQFEYTFEKINNNGNPYFPEANYVFTENDMPHSGWSAITYVKLDNNRLSVLGKKMIDGGNSSQSRHGSDYYYPLPLQYGTTWHSVRYDTLSLWDVIENQRYFNKVDATGKLKLPSGEYDCLRIRTSIVQMDGSYMGLKYYFLSKDYVLLAIVTSQPNDTTYNFTNASGVEYYTGFTGIGSGEVQKVRPETYSIFQNYPNPFNPSTTIRINIPEVTYGQLCVYNIRGDLIKVLFQGRMLGGEHKAVWDGTDQYGNKVSAGIYIYKFTSPKFTNSMRMVLLK